MLGVLFTLIEVVGLICRLSLVGSGHLEGLNTREISLLRMISIYMTSEYYVRQMMVELGDGGR